MLAASKIVTSIIGISKFTWIKSTLDIKIILAKTLSTNIKVTEFLKTQLEYRDSVNIISWTFEVNLLFFWLWS